MARALVLRHRGVELAVQLNKLDRAKLYGSVEVEALDNQGRKCELATLASDGKTLLGRGGTALGFVSADGHWLDRATLKPVNGMGETLVPVPSSFAAPVDVITEATVEDYLAHNVKSVYLLEVEAGASVEPLRAELAAGKIYRFPYSFRGGLVADVGFLLANTEGELFMAVGQSTHLHFIGLAEPAPTEDGADEPAEAADDELDFGML